MIGVNMWHARNQVHGTLERGDTSTFNREGKRNQDFRNWFI